MQIIQKPNVGNVYRPTAAGYQRQFPPLDIKSTMGMVGSDDENWSLLERAGFLRLRTSNVVSSISDAQNILSQRILAYPKIDELSHGTIRMEIDRYG
jgi:hypothetical protein